jgi:hypothetical protein
MTNTGNATNSTLELSFEPWELWPGVLCMALQAVAIYQVVIFKNGRFR